MEDGSILEEYLDGLVVLPVEVKRYMTLCRELDDGCQKERESLMRLQTRFLERLDQRLKANPTSSLSERQALVRELRQSHEFAGMEKTRKRLLQKSDEKVSISEQLFDMSERNLQLVTARKTKFRRLLHASGKLKEKTPKPVLNYAGRLVAACTGKDEQLWILCKVKDWGDSRVLVTDVDNPSQKYSLRLSHVVLLKGMQLCYYVIHYVSQRKKM